MEFVITNPRNFVFEVFKMNVLLKPIDISITKVKKLNNSVKVCHPRCVVN